VTPRVFALGLLAAVMATCLLTSTPATAGQRTERSAAQVTAAGPTVQSKAAAQSGCYSIGGGKYNCHVWKTAPSYWCTTTQETDSCTGQRVGWLYAGTNYFYCQTWGSRYADSGYYNHYWALTDDDSGNSRIWVPVVYISGGVNNGAIPGLPLC
jgi:hypothetical protein